MRTQALITATFKLKQRLLCFAVIGGVAALTHLFIVFQLVTREQLHPLLANMLAFFVAFNISYLGHRHLTFSRLNDNKQLRLPHFFLVASSAGLLNELLYFLLLKYTHLNYLPALFLVLGLISLYSYMISRHWACR